MQSLRCRLSYANVISTICLFLLLGGGAAVAAGGLGKNTVGSKQVKKNAIVTAKVKKEAITEAKLKAGAVTNPKLAEGAVTGAKVADGSLTGADINQATLTSVDAANVMRIAIEGDGKCTPALPLPSGVSIGEADKGFCEIDFPKPVAQCVFTATPRHRNIKGVTLLSQKTVELSDFVENPNSLNVNTFREDKIESEGFDLIGVC
jgi:hypothetical protein